MKSVYLRNFVATATLVTVSFLLSQGLMVKDEEAEYLLTECDKMVGSETAGAQRVRDYRNRKALHCNTDVTPVLRDCNVEKEIDTRDREESEKEKREEIEISLDKNICATEPYKKAQETKESHELFEYLWTLYPKKRGKGSVSDTQKKKLLKIGKDDMEQSIRNYLEEINNRGTDMKYVKNGSSFFNSGYIDYLPENYTPLPAMRRADNRYQSTAEYMAATAGWSDGIDD